MANKLLQQQRKDTFKDDESFLYSKSDIYGMYNDDECSDEHDDTDDKSYDKDIEQIHRNIQLEIDKNSRNLSESEVHEDFNRIQVKIDKICSEIQTEEQENNFQDYIEELLEKIEDETSKKNCILCSSKKRVEMGSCLSMGQHISMSGEKGTLYIRLTKKQIKLYSHHAIVKKVVYCTEKVARLSLIHFKQKEGKIQLCQTEETFDLERDELYVIEYRNPRYNPDAVVKRAERELELGIEINREYCLITNNCEHFATWCINGTTKSFQVEDIKSTLLTVTTALFGASSYITNFIQNSRIMMLLSIVQECKTYGISAVAASGASVSAVAGHLTLGIPALAYLIYCIVMTFQTRRNKNLCWSCKKRQICALWCHFAVFGGTAIIVYLFVHFALPLMMPAVSIPFLICLITLSAALMWMVPKQLEKFQSPLKFDNIRVTDMSKLHSGDIISFPYYLNRLEHAAVVTEVYPDENFQTLGRISIVHYSSFSFLTKKTIEEEIIEVDLRKKDIRKFDYGIMKVFPAHEVVSRARCRIGETQWHMASNRSDHLCYWALVDKRPVEYWEGISKSFEMGDASSKPLSTMLIAKEPVHISEEVQPGDVVQLREDKGIVTAVNNKQSKRHFELQFVTLERKLFNRKIRLNIEMVDLNQNDLTLFRYHPAHCISMQERVDKALDLKDKPSNLLTQSQFVEMCISIPHKCTTKRVHDISELHEGDVVSFPYYRLPHYFIVTDVEQEENNIKHRGHLKCIHYALPDLMSKRVIVEDRHKINLITTKVFLVKFEHIPTYQPKEIVSRARKRVGEKKWDGLSNRSDHLCRWAVTNESQLQHENNSTSTCKSKTSYFQKPVHLMEEILPGDVVEFYHENPFSSVKGILVKLTDLKDKREFKMDIIMYIDRPRLESKVINLKKEKLFVRTYSPSLTLTREERIRKAENMKDRKEKGLTKKAFIKKCIFKNTE